jgi:hypothetical protein
MKHRHENGIQTLINWSHLLLPSHFDLLENQGRRVLKNSPNKCERRYNRILKRLREDRTDAMDLGVTYEVASAPIARFHKELEQARALDDAAYHTAQADEANRKAGVTDNNSDSEQAPATEQVAA